MNLSLKSWYISMWSVEKFGFEVKDDEISVWSFNLWKLQFSLRTLETI
jgi:hypothetical protein